MYITFLAIFKGTVYSNEDVTEETNFISIPYVNPPQSHTTCYSILKMGEGVILLTPSDSSLPYTCP